jgi:hypothetical protein
MGLDNSRVRQDRLLIFRSFRAANGSILGKLRSIVCGENKDVLCMALLYHVFIIISNMCH